MSDVHESPDAVLAALAAGIRLGDVPQDVRDAAIDCIVDTIAVAIAGSDHAVTESVSRVMESAGAATVIGRHRGASVGDAAWLNALSAHVLDFDDWLPAAGVHPSAPVLAAALATAQVQADPVAGTDLLAAYIAGFETQARIGAAIAPSHYEAGFHPTATVGTFGAAVASAHVGGATPATMAGTLGMASTAAAGIRAAFGTAGKAIQVGKAAANGVLAARLVAAGATAPIEAVLGARGFAATHDHPVDEHVATLPFESHWHLRDVAVKRHASCFGTHAPIDAVLALRQQFPLDRIARVEITVSEIMRTVCAIPSPSTSLEGKFSLSFTAALALTRGRCGVAEFTDKTVHDHALREVMRLITVGFRPELEPQRGQVRITLDDGTIHAAEGNSAIPPAPQTRGRIAREKLTAHASPLLGVAGAADLLEVIEGLGIDRSVSDLAAALNRR